jgi:CheY-like chemotaxis protein
MPRILIADDDEETRAILSRVLEDEGYTVETVPDGRTALEMATAAPPDLLIADLIIPGLTGWSLFARIRRQKSTLPIILISGAAAGVPQQETSLPDHTVFLRKPLEIDHLLEIIAHMMLAAPLSTHRPKVLPRLHYISSTNYFSLGVLHNGAAACSDGGGLP